MRSKVFIFLIFSLFLFSFVSAANSFTEENTDGLQVFEPRFDFLKQDMPFTFHLHVSNITKGKTLSNADVDCYMHLYNSSGHHTLETGVLEKEANGWDHEITVAGGNFSDLGWHNFYFWCNSTDAGGEVKGTFFVTPTGEEATT